VGVFSDTGALKHWNILAGGAVVGRYESGAKRYYHRDHLGTTRVVVDASGTVQEARDYYPFGLEMPGRTTLTGTGAREGFTGKERDAETDLDYFGARYYMAALGRWGNVDRFAEKYSSLSPYNYVANNPLMFIDINGDSLYVENTYRTGFLGLFGSKVTERAVYRNGQWYTPGTSDAFSSSNGTMNGLMNQVAGSMQAMNSAGGDATIAAGAIESSTSFTAIATRTNRNHVMVDRQKQTALIELTGSTGVTSGFLRQGTGTMSSSALTAGVHELGHAYDGIAGISRSIAIAQRNTPFYTDAQGSPQGYAEVVSMHIENVVRSSLRLALREHYASVNGRYVGPALLPKTNCSAFMPNNPCY